MALPLPRPAALAALILIAAAAAPVRAGSLIVVSGPAEGRMADVTKAIGTAVEQAVRSPPVQSLAAGEPIRIVTEPDGCEAGTARKAAERIVAMKPALVVGHPCDAAAIASADVYRKSKTLFIAPASRHPALTDAGANLTVFRLAGRDDAEGTAAGYRLAEAAPAKRVAIIQDRTRYARTLTESARRALATRGLAQPVIVPIVAGQRGYPAAATQAMASKPEAIFFAGFPTEAGLVLEDLRQAGFHGPFVVSGAVDTTDFAARVKSSQTRWGDVEVMRPEPLRASATAADLKIPNDLPAPAAAAYMASFAAVEVWAQAAAKARETSPPTDIAALLHGSEFEPTLIGRVKFDAKGDADIVSFAAHDLNAVEPVSENAAPR